MGVPATFENDNFYIKFTLTPLSKVQIIPPLILIKIINDSIYITCEIPKKYLYGGILRYL